MAPVQWRLKYVAEKGKYTSVMSIEIDVKAGNFFEAQLLAERAIRERLPFGSWVLESGLFVLDETNRRVDVQED